MVWRILSRVGGAGGDAVDTKGAFVELIDEWEVEFRVSRTAYARV